jgi:hypothetical protein
MPEGIFIFEDVGLALKMGKFDGYEGTQGTQRHQEAFSGACGGREWCFFL